jgi:hypothetical protein
MRRGCLARSTELVGQIDEPGFQTRAASSSLSTPIHLAEYRPPQRGARSVVHLARYCGAQVFMRRRCKRGALSCVVATRLRTQRGADRTGRTAPARETRLGVGASASRSSDARNTPLCSPPRIMRPRTLRQSSTHSSALPIVVWINLNIASDLGRQQAVFAAGKQRDRPTLNGIRAFGFGSLTLARCSAHHAREPCRELTSVFYTLDVIVMWYFFKR